MELAKIPFVKYPRDAVGMENTSKRSLELAKKNGDVRQIYEHDGDVKHDSIKIDLQDIAPGLFQARCIFSHLCDFGAAVCTLDPTDGFGEKVVKGRGEQTLYFSVYSSQERFFDLAIDNEPTSLQSLKRELNEGGKQTIKSFVDFGDGVMILMPIFRAAPVTIGIEHLHGKLKSDCEKLGVKAAIAGYRIEMLKELFKPCFPGARGHNGYIPLPKAFCAKFRRTVFELKDDIEEQKNILRFRNPITNTFFELPNAKAYYKMILYVISHISSNLNARRLAIEGDRLVEVLARTCPSLLETRGGKLRIRNIYNAKLFVDKSMYLLNAMGRKGFCDTNIAISERTFYYKLPTGGFGVEISYKRTANRLDVPFYQSNLELPTECPF